MEHPLYTQMQNALLHLDKPSVFFNQLRSTPQLEKLFPELYALIGVEQSPRYHAEGDVWNHTMLVVDHAAERRGRVEEKLGFMLAALCHDLGKPACSAVVKGEIHAYHHETEGLLPTETFLRRFTEDEALIGYVLQMVAEHMHPNNMVSQDSSRKSFNKLFDRICSPEALIHLASSDNAGSVPDHPRSDREPALWRHLDDYSALMKQPWFTREELLAAGVSPNADMENVLAYAHKLRLAELDRQNALGQILAYARKFSRTFR